MEILVRQATLADAHTMADLRAASIRLLCSADHHGDAIAIAQWIGPPDKFVHLLDIPAVHMVVADIDGAMAGLGALSGDMVTLNYVHPDHRFRGVSKAVMQALEMRLATMGVVVGRLHSTATALPFYRSLGWIETGPGTPGDGVPMQKRL